ncbi:hypothetical protein [Gallaecimonas mangrovi]|uniref:hypothetical protein n=1 Tax=Gallaecimonas mangrovi TaxID=2291597 RepID=UPI000E2002D7|nr:hypothetical protein [Gallaecimonas mangrovi]
MPAPNVNLPRKGAKYLLREYGLFAVLALSLHLLVLCGFWQEPSTVKPPMVPEPIKARLIFAPAPVKAQAAKVGTEQPTKPNTLNAKERLSGYADAPNGAASLSRQHLPQERLPAHPKSARRAKAAETPLNERKPSAKSAGESFGLALEQSLNNIAQQQQQQWLNGQRMPGVQAIERPKANTRKAQIIDLGGGQRLYFGADGSCALLVDVPTIGGEKETHWLATSACKKKGADFQKFIDKRSHKNDA